MPSGLELARLRGLGQQPPLTDPGGAPLDYEEPDAYLDPAEQQMLMPRGLPGPNRSGGLGQLGLMSRLADVVHGPSGPSATPPPPGAEEAKLREAPKASAAADVSGAPARGRTWMTGAPDAAAEAERAQRQAGAYGSLAESGAKLAKLVLTAAMGGGAGAGGVAGAGEAGGAAGTATGASSGAGFGANYMSGLKSGAGTGTGGLLGRLSSGVATGSTQGTESGALSRLSESPNGGRFDDALSALTGSAARRRAALEAAGQGPYGAGLVSDTGGVPWAGGS